MQALEGKRPHTFGSLNIILQEAQVPRNSKD